MELRRRDKFTGNSMDVSRKGGKGQEIRRGKLAIHSIRNAEARRYAHLLLNYKLGSGVELKIRHWVFFYNANISGIILDRKIRVLFSFDFFLLVGG